jgi:hypothetical protein
MALRDGQSGQPVTAIPKLSPTVTEQLTGVVVHPTTAIPMQTLQQLQAMQARDPLKPRKVAIVGTQPSSRMLAPFGDPEWTIWGTSPGNQNILPRVDAWFEMHCNLLWPQYKHYGETYIKWLNEVKFPVVAQDQRLVKNAIVYPLQKMLKRFGPYFFTSTFAWVMAYAIDAGVEAMGLYGVDMSSRDEYIQQRNGGQYFLQMARNAGIQVIIPDESDLEQPPPLYGYSDATPFGRKMATREQEVRERITQLEQQLNPLQQQLIYMRGALEDIQYFRQVYGSVDQHGHILFDGAFRAAGNGRMETEPEPWQASLEGITPAAPPYFSRPLPISSAAPLSAWASSGQNWSQATFRTQPPSSISS